MCNAIDRALEWFLLRGTGFVVGLILYPAALQLYHGLYEYIFVDFARARVHAESSGSPESFRFPTTSQLFGP